MVDEASDWFSFLLYSLEKTILVVHVQGTHKKSTNVTFLNRKIYTESLKANLFDCYCKKSTFEILEVDNLHKIHHCYKQLNNSLIIYKLLYLVL